MDKKQQPSGFAAGPPSSPCTSLGAVTGRRSFLGSSLHCARHDSVCLLPSAPAWFPGPPAQRLCQCLLPPCPPALLASVAAKEPAPGKPQAPCSSISPSALQPPHPLGPADDGLLPAPLLVVAPQPIRAMRLVQLPVPPPRPGKHPLSISTAWHQKKAPLPSCTSIWLPGNQDRSPEHLGFLPRFPARS